MLKLSENQQRLLEKLNQIDDTKQLVRVAIEQFAPKLAIASSFSAEDMVLMHLISTLHPGIEVLAIDTGRLPEATYQAADLAKQQFNIKLKWLFPESQPIEKLLADQGSYGFRQTVQLRKQCCQTRKVDVLARGLKPFSAWITGQRQAHSQTRRTLKLAEQETIFSPWIKLNPLCTWNTKDIWAYIAKYQLPTHAWYRQGYTSIGCAPCTRPITRGEAERAGRWWWEDLKQHKECGLHHR